MNRELLDKLSVVTEEEQAFLDGKQEIEKQRYTDGETLVVDAGKLLEGGKLISVRPHTRFVHFPAHRHNYVEMIYMCQGSIRQRIDGEELILREGELLLMNQDTVQEIWPAGKEDIAVNFIILPEFFDRTLQIMGDEENQLRDFIVGCLTGKDQTIRYLHFQVSDVLPIQNLVENLVWTILHRQPNRRSIHQVTMGLLFLQLMNYTERIQVGEEHREQGVLLAVYRYIEEHYRNGQLGDLAGELHYDVCNMSRMIHRMTGRTYTELLQEKRLQQAAFLLETTRLPVTDIADAVGYENMSNFHRIFRKKYGSSPKEYRTEKRM